MSFKTVLFGKVDLDTIATALVFGVNPLEQALRVVAGSASEADLQNTSTLCIEVGGSGRVAQNNFDHHDPKGPNLCAAAQALERLARIIRYVDDVDCGRFEKVGSVEFPSLIQLVSGMMFTIKSPEQQMEHGLRIFREVLHSGTDPYGCMEPILDSIPHARWWANQKKIHEQRSESVCADAKWYTTRSGKKLAVVETDWIGAPGALYGKGADIVIALNENFEQSGKTYRKFTVASQSVEVAALLPKLSAIENGWGGPAHKTIIGSPQGISSIVTVGEVCSLVIEIL